MLSKVEWNVAADDERRKRKKRYIKYGVWARREAVRIINFQRRCSRALTDQIAVFEPKNAILT